MGSLALGFVGSCPDAAEGVDAPVAEPVAGSFPREDVGVVHDSVDHGCGDDLASEHARPGRRVPVAGQDRRRVSSQQETSWKNRFAASCSKGK